MYSAVYQRNLLVCCEGAAWLAKAVLGRSKYALALRHMTQLFLMLFGFEGISLPFSSIVIVS